MNNMRLGGERARRNPAIAKKAQVGGVGPSSVNWAGQAVATLVSPHKKTSGSVGNGGTVLINRSLLGKPGDVQFDLQVWAPGVTNVWWDKTAAVHALGLHVASPLMTNKPNIPVTYQGQAGINGNDFQVRVLLSDILRGETFPNPGRYPVYFKAGEKILNTVMVQLTNP